MNKVVRWMAVSMTAVMLAAPAVRAEGWSLTKLNPFAKSTSSSKKKKSSITKPNFKLPRWKTPAPIQKVNQSTTRMASKTWDTLTFWDNKKPTNRWESGSKTTKKAKPQKESWLSNLFTVEDDKPKTPGEFLSLPRPE